MKKLIYLFFLLLIPFSGCQKVSLQLETREGSEMKISTAQQEFAKILSKALYHEESMREFIKNEAFKKFDNDFDVFYPFIKDRDLGNGRTFRELLIDYSEDRELFLRIETSLQKLTILVPDWSWCDCFNINKWSTADRDICVGVQYEEERTESRSLFYKGEKILGLNYNDIPDFPVLIIKENERIKVSNITNKGATARYEFIDEAFDGRIKTKGTSIYDWSYNTDGSSSFVPKEMLNDLVIGAYEEFGNAWNNAMHRDYIYFGMNKSNTSHGISNTFIRERILRFKIPVSARASMTTPGQDPEFINEITRWRVENAFKGNEIQPYLWSDGAFEICFDFFLGNSLPDQMITYRKRFSVEPHEIWELTKSKVKKTMRPFDGFKYRYVYTNDVNDLVAKWYYPSSVVDLPYWNISNQSTNIFIRASEYDEKSSKTEEVVQTYKYTNNIKYNTGLNGGEEVKWSLGLDFNSGSEFGITTTSKYTIEYQSNPFGDLHYSFDMPIIISKEYSRNGQLGYDIKNISSGEIDLSIIPYDIRF